MDKEIIKKADTLIEALPYIQSFYGKTVVIKYGGAAMTDKSVRHNVLKDIVFMNFVGMRPILVHGGGPHISKRIEKQGGEVKFVKGIRVTDEASMAIAEEELTKIGRQIAEEIVSLGGSAVSIAGKDRLVEVKKRKNIDGQDMGFVGEITKIDAEIIERMIASDVIPVIAPIGVNKKDRHSYNINADDVAAEIAGSMSAVKFVLLTNVEGIMESIKDSATLLSRVSITDVKKLVKTGIVSGGMIPKVNACVRALECGVLKTHIINEKAEHALLLEIFTDKGIGTEIVKK